MEDVKDQVKEDYLNGMKYKDLEKKYKTSINTIKSWIKRYGWSKEKRNRGAPKKEKGCTQKGNKKDKSSSKKELIEYEVKDVLENTELTDKQRLFCIYYIKCFNATKAYQKAYGCSYDVANVEGYNTLVKPSIKFEIDKLKRNKLNRAALSEDDIFQRYIDIAFSDITDYLDFGSEEAEGEFGPYTRSYVKLKDSSRVDGTLINEVSQGKEGIKLKLQDKMKALQWLSDRMDLLPTNTRLKLENEKTKLELDVLKLELDMLKQGGQDEEIEDDGFLDALKSEVGDTWND